MSSVSDHATSRQGWSYDTGQPNRQPNLVIKVDVRGDPKDSPTGLETLASNGPVTIINSDAEIDNVDVNDLAVVVGLLLHKYPQDELDRQEFPGFEVRAKRKTNTGSDKQGRVRHNQLSHRVLETTDKVFYVVRKLSSARNVLYGLSSRNQDGFLTLVPLPNRDQYEPYLVIYKEWDVRSDSSTKRSGDITGKRLEAVDEFVTRFKTLRGDRVAKTSINPTADTIEKMGSPGINSAVLVEFVKILAEWEKRTGDKDFIRSGLQIIKRYTGYEPVPNARDKYHGDPHAAIRDLFYGGEPFDLTDAEVAATACRVS